MTWIYTILFSGLIFATQPETASKAPITLSPVSISIPQDGDITERVDNTYPLSAEGRVSISNINGRIELEGWDKEEAALVVEKTGPNKEMLDSVKVIVDSDRDHFRLRTEHQDWTRSMGSNAKRQVQVSIKMKLPRRAVLDEIESVNGDIAISNFENSVKASCVNGSVSINRLKGRATASTVNGSIAADYGQLDARTQVELSSVNGPVKIIIPTDSDVTLKGETLNGGITTDFGLAVRKANFVGHSLHSRLGGGSANVKVESVNGPLFIGHPNDGRSPAPVTDLLSANETDDGDGSITHPRRISTRVMSAEAAKAVAEANRQSAKAMKEALKTAQKETEQAVIVSGPLIERSVKEALDAAREQIRMADIGKAAAREAKRALRVSAKMRVFSNGFGNERIFGADPAISRHSKSFTVKGTPDVTIVAPGCAVNIVGTDESVVRYTVREIRSAKEDSAIEVKDKADSDSVQINVSGYDSEPWRVRVDVFVPRKSNLKVTTDGEIRVDGVSGTLDLKGYDDSITLHDSDGKLLVASSAGRIRAVGFRGDVKAQTESGTVDLEGEFGQLTAMSDLGDIVVTVGSNFSGQFSATDEPIQFDGLTATRVGTDEDSFVYKIGNGGPNYLLQTDGNIIVRNSDSLLSMK